MFDLRFDPKAANNLLVGMSKADVASILTPSKYANSFSSKVNDKMPFLIGDIGK